MKKSGIKEDVRLVSPPTKFKSSESDYEHVRTAEPLDLDTMVTEYFSAEQTAALFAVMLSKAEPEFQVAVVRRLRYIVTARLEEELRQKSCDAEKVGRLLQEI